MSLAAYHGKKSLKKDILAEARKHQKADKIIQGSYGTGKGHNWKGCAVACTIKSYNNRCGKDESTSDHSVYERDLGIPRILAKLEDRIFEGLAVEESKTFPVRFLAAIEPGADLSLVWPKFIVWVLTDPEHGIIKFAKADGKKSIKKVVELYNKQIAGKDVKVEDWRKARAAAYAAAYDADADAAAYDAAYAAADAAAAYDAAYDAADAADAAAADAAAAYAADAAAAAYAAADAAAAAYAADAARKHQYRIMADKLIELLKEAK